MRNAHPTSSRADENYLIIISSFPNQSTTVVCPLFMYSVLLTRLSWPFFDHYFFNSSLPPISPILIGLLKTTSAVKPFGGSSNFLLLPLPPSSPSFDAHSSPLLCTLVHLSPPLLLVLSNRIWNQESESFLPRPFSLSKTEWDIPWMSERLGQPRSAAENTLTAAATTVAAAVS